MGLTPQPSDNKSGYHGVRKDEREKDKPFQAMVRGAGKDVHPGSFATAEVAALAYARTPEAQAQVANPKAAPLTAAEVVAQAAAEGLTLEPGSGAAGYKGVNVDGSRYRANVWRAGKLEHLGSFATAEEAALTVARANGRTDPPAASPAAKPAPLTAEEVVAQAAAEGLTLEPGSNMAGYEGVSYCVNTFSYKARVTRTGKLEHLGRFDTAEEAALAVARANAHAHLPAAAPRPAAAKRAAPPPHMPPAKLQPKANSKEPTAAPNPASACTASVRLEVGQSVEACFGGRGHWFPGVVQHINADGTLAIDYDDGDQEERVLRKHIRPSKAKARPPSPPASTSSGRLRTAPQWQALLSLLVL